MKKYRKLVILLAFMVILTSAKQTFASVVWEENFDDVAIDQKGATGSGSGAVIDMAGITRWSINTLAGDGNLSATTDWFRVDGGVFEGRDLDVDSIWETELIDITGLNKVSFELDALENGDMEGSGSTQDYFDVYYSLDGGVFTRIPNWNSFGNANHTLTGDLPDDGDWVATTIFQNIPSGHNSLKIRVIMMDGAGSEYLQLDNVKVLKNNIPVVSDLGSILNFTEGDVDTAIDTTITIVDNNDINMEEASITITGNYQNGEDSLVYIDTATIIGVWDAPTGTLDLLGTETKANYEIAFESIKYNNTTSPVTTLDRTITWKVNDGDVNSAGVTSTISLTATNSIPTDIKLDTVDVDSVNENTPSGTNISVITTTDSDVADTHAYTLVAGIGDEDNAKFNIVGTNLQLNFTPDYENPTDIGDTAGNNTYSIRIQTDDGNGGTYQKSFIITVNDVNAAPTDIALSSLNMNEGIAANTTIGTLFVTDDGEDGTYTYTLPAFGDNADFTIIGTSLNINAIPDFETKASYSIKINVNDGVHNFEKIFTLTVNDLDENIPVISLLGSPTLTLTVGDIYVDAGATANDDIDGDITGSIVTVNPVNTAVAGTYTITYNVSDSSANTAIEVTRMVEVIEPPQASHHGSKRISKQRLAEIFGKKESSETTEQEINPNEQENNLCSAEKIIHENLKLGDRNGNYSPWKKGNITEVKILQAHMNRLGFNSGIVDGIFGQVTDGAIKRMQRSLGFTGKLVDGYVGVLTREAINHSC